MLTFSRFFSFFVQHYTGKNGLVVELFIRLKLFMPFDFITVEHLPQTITFILFYNVISGSFSVFYLFSVLIYCIKTTFRKED